MVTNHEDILIRTLVGLEEDLDELRHELMRQIEAFEGGAKQRVKELPVWLALPYRKIKQIIRFPQDSSFHEALLGPRAVALAAGEIEQFVHTWVGEHGVLADLTRISQSNAARPWGRDASLMTLYLDNLEHEAQAVMIAARTSLVHMRDEILAELEEQRRADCEALEELVSRGDLAQGQQARKEIAELWEDQRRRANTFSQRWEGLERHIEQGLDITESGLDTLRDLLENAELGLAQAYTTTTEEEQQDEAPGEANASEEPSARRSPPEALQVIGSAQADSLDFDFNPYGEEKEKPVEAPVVTVASSAPSSTGRKHVNEDFFKSDEVNDDLIFANESQLDGPMIDFGDEEPDSQRASHQLFSSTLETSTTAQTPSSPYEIFLGDDSDVSYQDHPVAIDPRPAGKPTRSPEHSAPTPTGKPALRPPPSTPPQEQPAPYPRLALAEQELEEVSAAEESSVPPSVTLPYNGSPMAEVLDEVLEDVAPHVIVRHEVDDVSTPTAPMINEVDAPTLPPRQAIVDTLDTPTMPAGGWGEEDAQVAEIETVEIDRDDDPEIIGEDDGRVEETLEKSIGEKKPAVRAARPVAATPVEEIAPPPKAATQAAMVPEEKEEKEEHEEDSSFAWQAEATRRRQLQRPIAAAELGLALGAPVALALLLVVQALIAANVAERWLVSSMVARGLAFGACIWVVIGPLIFLQWKIGWRGARPVPYRVQLLRDEAELILSDETLEVGEEMIRREEVRESSLERWEDQEEGVSGLKFCVERATGRPLVFVCVDTEDMPSLHAGHPLPRVKRPVLGSWEVTALTLSRVVAWSRSEDRTSP